MHRSSGGTSFPEIRAVIDALQALRGVAHITVRPWLRKWAACALFENPRQLMGYTGLVVPREHSSGNRTRRAAITRTGNAHLRRVLVKLVWAHRHRPAVDGRLFKRQKALTLSVEAKHIAWAGAAAH
jgi:transposase